MFAWQNFIKGQTGGKNMLSKRKEEQIREPIFTVLNSIEK